MQVGRGDARGVGDGVDLRLVAPVAANMRDGAAHDVVVRGRRRKRCELGEAVGRQVVLLLMAVMCHAPHLSGYPGDARPPDFWLMSNTRPRRAAAGFDQRVRRARSRNRPFRRGRESSRSSVACRATPGTAGRCRIPPFDLVELDPERVEHPFAHAAAMADLAHGQCRGVTVTSS